MDLEQFRLRYVTLNLMTEQHILGSTSLLEDPEAFVELSYLNAKSWTGKGVKRLVTEAQQAVDKLFRFYQSSRFSKYFDENKMTQDEYNCVKSFSETRKTFYL